MATYSEWLDSTRTLYTTAMTTAYANRDNVDTTNVWYRGWQAMTATSDLASVIAPNSSFFMAQHQMVTKQILYYSGIGCKPILRQLGY